MKRSLATALALFAFGCIANHCTGCRPRDKEPEVVETRVKNAFDLGRYQRDLDMCRAAGRDAGSYSVYENCAQDADKDAGKKP